MVRSKVLCLFGAFLFLAFVCLGIARADTYPSKPVTLVIPWSAGGSHDLHARIFVGVIPQYLGQPMVVKLMPGAGGQLATASVINAKADGYTLLFTHNFVDQLQPLIEKLPYDTTKALVTVCRLSNSPAIAFVRADSPFKTLKDLLEYGKANPGKLKFASTGNWAAQFTFGAMLFSRAGVKAKFLPYKGGGPTLAALLAGEADFCFSWPNPLIDLQRGGKVRILAVGSVERLKELPDVPTLKELGYGTGYLMDRVVMVQREIPEDRLKILRDSFHKLNGDKSYQSLMKRVGENTLYMDGPDYEKERVEYRKEYQKLVKEVLAK
jgi:tripartite-type tricarboxylate transporter receptor subunit TctC